MNTNYISKIFSATAFSGVVLLVLFVLSIAGVNAQTLVSGNPTCADINSNNAAFPSLIFDNGFSTGETPLTGQTYNIPNVGNVTVTYNSDSDISFSATSNFITAVIVKGGDNANVYVFNPAASSGSSMITPLNNGGKRSGLSHLVFCYNNVSLVPTSATAMIAGRVSVDTEFIRGKGTLLVTILNTSTSETQSTFTNRLGYYEFNDLQVGETYVVSVRGKGYNFTPQVISLLEDSALDMRGTAVGRSESKGQKGNF